MELVNRSQAHGHGSIHYRIDWCLGQFGHWRPFRGQPSPVSALAVPDPVMPDLVMPDPAIPDPAMPDPAMPDPTGQAGIWKGRSSAESAPHHALGPRELARNREALPKQGLGDRPPKTVQARKRWDDCPAPDPDLQLAPARPNLHRAQAQAQAPAPDPGPASAQCPWPCHRPAPWPRPDPGLDPARHLHLSRPGLALALASGMGNFRGDPKLHLGE